jgi:pimeloyl-ACP methyl ester carboxylesterase
MPKQPWRIAAAYCVVLLASHATESAANHWLPRAPANPDLRFTDLPMIEHGAHLPRSVHLAYRDSAPDSSKMPVILIHGSPGSGQVMAALSQLLSTEFRVIVPDLPGFGSSTREMPDYSFRTHAEYLIELMDALKIPKAQLVGFSMGGGVVLSMYQIAPERVSSVAMLSAIGVQEYELTGSYRLNHLIHGAQLGVLWLIRNGVPHFGLFKKVPFTLEYARNFYDSDQRPLRGVIERYQGSMLIIHGTRDRNVPIAAAREHHRLVPQSELVELDEDHFMTFKHPSVFIEPLMRFLRQPR